MAVDAMELARRVREGETTSEALVAQATAALDAVDPQLRAVVYRHEAPAVSEEGADGPFAGVPFVLKDLDGLEKGVPNTGSARFNLDYVPGHDSVVIARMRAAGFVFIARTACPELGTYGTTESDLRGATHNPYDLSRTPGGSSGGTAALVAAGVVPAGHGGDGGGSLRIPAAACGLVGLKPSRGRVPVEGGEGWGGFVQQGSITRSVRDTAAILDAIRGPAPGVPYVAPPLPGPLLDEVGRDPGTLRIGWSTRSLYGQHTHPSCVAAVERAVELLASLGHELHEAEPAIDRDELARAYLVQVAAGNAATVRAAEKRAGRRSRRGDWEPATWFLVQLGEALSARELTESRDAAHRAAQQTAAFHQQYDLFLNPTLGQPPVELGTLLPSRLERLGLGVMRAAPVRTVMMKALEQLAADSLEATPNTQLFNQTGQPAVSLPLHVDPTGLPIGVQLAAAYGREDLLVRVASQLESAAPRADRWPPVAADWLR
jgi:amidase